MEIPKNIYKIKDDLEKIWTGEYCQKHPGYKIYECREPANICNEKYSMGNDINGNIIWRDKCDVRNFCNNRKRCGQCDIEYLNRKAIDHQTWWQTVGREDAEIRFWEKKQKTKKKQTKFAKEKPRQEDYRSRQYVD